MGHQKTHHLQPHRRPSKPPYTISQNGEREGRDRRSVRAIILEFASATNLLDVLCLVARIYELALRFRRTKRWNPRWLFDLNWRAHNLVGNGATLLRVAKTRTLIGSWKDQFSISNVE